MLMRDFTTVKQIFNGQSVVAYLILTVFAVVTTLLLSYKFLQCIQQKNYCASDYFKWINKKNNVFVMKIIMLSLLSCFAFCLFNVVFAFIKNDYFTFLGFVFYLFFIVLSLLGERKMENKVPLKYTNRIKRLIATYCVISFIIFFALLILENLIFYYFSDFFKLERFAIVTIFPSLMPFLIFVSDAINKPIEKRINKKFVKKVTEFLDKSNLIKIGITGSYGKTSVKNYLRDILSVKYRVVATPSSYNTPMGICKSAELIKDDTQVFIAEMGARQKGDIKELCEIVKPQIGVLTGIAPVHLLTFGNLENVIKTKNEIMEYPSIQTGVFTADNENVLKLYEDFKKEKFLAGENEKALVKVSNVKADKNGSSFDLTIDGETVTCQTEILGRHNISNVALACAVAYKLGLTLQEISEGIKNLKSVEHRLNLINENGVTIIDDGYNSNVEGTKSALETLSYFSGRKIIITPGMTELGLEQNKLNYDFGVRMANVADYVILVEGGSCNAIREGLVFGGEFDAEKVKIVASLQKAKEKLAEIVKEGDVILFENDLTDRF
ncbi:MAG TPA: UDP-N-acetylmuramoyl-tripeptide--D-alanyl-D-alanine ligase [Clostridiales bacterium]|nr:UDP-N-acetylmuramoyl-tripeptide--D-alanyl-D-alanine ligase [Clostridiales bacterium]